MASYFRVPNYGQDLDNGSVGYCSSSGMLQGASLGSGWSLSLLHVFYIVEYMVFRQLNGIMAKSREKP